MYVCVWLYFILYVCGCTSYCICVVVLYIVCVPSGREEWLSRLFRGNKQTINQSISNHGKTDVAMLTSSNMICGCSLYSIDCGLRWLVCLAQRKQTKNQASKTSKGLLLIN